MGQIAPFNSPRLSASARTFSFGSEFVGNANSRISSEAGGNNPGRQFAQRTKILMDCSTDELKKERVASCELRVKGVALLAARNSQLPRSYPCPSGFHRWQIFSLFFAALLATSSEAGGESVFSGAPLRFELPSKYLRSDSILVAARPRRVIRVIRGSILSSYRLSPTG